MTQRPASPLSGTDVPKKRKTGEGARPFHIGLNFLVIGRVGCHHRYRATAHYLRCAGTRLRRCAVIHSRCLREGLEPSIRHRYFREGLEPNIRHRSSLDRTSLHLSV